jgi:RepB plasmid partitioning protein
LTGVNFKLIFHDGPAQTAIGTQVTSPDNPMSGSALDAAGRRIQKRALFHPTERRRDAICLAAVYVWPALMAATRREDLAQPGRPKNIRGLTAEQIARMEREMEGLEREFNAVAASYGDTVLNLVVASSYVSQLIGNPRVIRYLARHHQEILTEFQAIVAATSLEEGVRTRSEEPAFLG